jgi:hypothetical protein
MGGRWLAFFARLFYVYSFFYFKLLYVLNGLTVPKTENIYSQWNTVFGGL